MRERVRHRHIAEPVVLEEDEDEKLPDEEAIKREIKEESDEEEIDEDERVKRRLELKKKALQRQEVSFTF